MDEIRRDQLQDGETFIRLFESGLEPLVAALWVRESGDEAAWHLLLIGRQASNFEARERYEVAIQILRDQPSLDISPTLLVLTTSSDEKYKSIFIQANLIPRGVEPKFRRLRLNSAQTVDAAIYFIESPEDSLAGLNKGHGRFELKKAKNGKYFFSLIASNGIILLVSAMYESKTSALRALEAVSRYAARAEGFEQLRGKDGSSYFVVRSPNGHVLAVSEMYSSPEAAQAGQKAVQRTASVKRKSIVIS